MKKQILSLLALSCLSISLALPVISEPSRSSENEAAIPKITFPETEFNFGVLEEGIEAKHTFKIENHGSKELIIKTVFSTCGCTIPTMKTKHIAPGTSADMEVVMNTSMKQGDVKKPIEVRSNDPINPVSTLYVTAKVTSPHANLGENKIAAIFEGKCARCHVADGIGKVGEELYAADCAMCHGYRAKGIPSVAPTLIPYDYQNKDFAAAFKHIIAFGSASHRSMPGYAKEAGGPLNDKEIDSLIDFLQKKSEEERHYQQLMKEQAEKEQQKTEESKKKDEPPASK